MSSKDSKSGGSAGLLLIDAYYTKLAYDALSDRTKKPNYSKLIAALEARTGGKFKYSVRRVLSCRAHPLCDLM